MDSNDFHLDSISGPPNFWDSDTDSEDIGTGTVYSDAVLSKLTF
jgi:hypothetical protein